MSAPQDSKASSRLEALASPTTVVCGLIGIFIALFVGVTVPLYFRLLDADKEALSLREKITDLGSKKTDPSFDERKKMFDFVIGICDAADKEIAKKRFTQFKAIFQDSKFDENVCDFDTLNIFSYSPGDALILKNKDSSPQSKYDLYLRVLVPMSKDVMPLVLKSFQFGIEIEDKKNLKFLQNELEKKGLVPAKVSAANTTSRVFTGYDTSKSKIGDTKFQWPFLDGLIIARFGGKNDGINISAPEGAPIRSTSDGVVAYAGDELKGYGNLILVRHSDRYISAYAHLSELRVSRGDTVERGQVIGLAGQTGNVTGPQLHFELRLGSTPQDPESIIGAFPKLKQ
jgi:murein DD-endopeptidase MepM/ murein hydrolase activator NlpD